MINQWLEFIYVVLNDFKVILYRRMIIVKAVLNISGLFLIICIYILKGEIT